MRKNIIKGAGGNQANGRDNRGNNQDKCNNGIKNELLIWGTFQNHGANHLNENERMDKCHRTQICYNRLNIAVFNNFWQNKAKGKNIKLD